MQAELQKTVISTLHLLTDGSLRFTGAVLFLIWFLPFVYVINHSTLVTLYENAQNGRKAHAFVLISILLYTFVLMLSFMLGMIRRIRTKTFWKNSLTCRILSLIRLFFRKLKDFFALYFYQHCP